MTKGVRVAEALGIRVNETELAVMCLVDKPMGGTVVSSKALSERAGKCIASIKTSLRKLSEKGLGEVHLWFLANGGKLESDYEVTPLGKQVLAACGKRG